MEEQKKVIRIGIVILAVLVVLAGVYYFFFYARPEKPAEEIAAPEKMPEISVEEPPFDATADVFPLKPEDLDKSDAMVRSLVSNLSSHPMLAHWLRTSNIIRRFTAAVDNIANGLSPRPHLDFFQLKRDFQVSSKGGKFFQKPANFTRYNPAADAFSDLDTAGCARLYRHFKPLIQAAHRELGYPTGDFDETLLRAMAELLKTPVVEGEIPLEKEVVTFRYADPALEGLSDAQKHLLRMGQENVLIIQAKLQELWKALGFPEERMPPSRTYFPPARR